MQQNSMSPEARPDAGAVMNDLWLIVDELAAL